MRESNHYNFEHLDMPRVVYRNDGTEGFILADKNIFRLATKEDYR